MLFEILDQKALTKWNVIVYRDFLCKFAVFQLAALVDLIFDTIVDSISPKFLVSMDYGFLCLSL